VLSGRVVQPDGTPVRGATITLGHFGDTATTSDSGRFTLPNVVPGAHVVVARHVGFPATRVAVTIAGGQTKDVTITLASGVAALPVVRTTTAAVPSAYHRVGLDKRISGGVGHFVTYDQIEQRQASRMTELLRLLPGLHLSDAFGQDPAIQPASTRGPGSCVGFIVDGAPQQTITTHDVDAMIPAGDVAAIEYYRASEAPAGWKAQAPMQDTLPSTNGLFQPPQQTTSSGPGATPSRQPGSNAGQPSPGPTVAPPSAHVIVRQTCDVVAVWTKSRLGLTGGRTGLGVTSDVPVAVARALFPDSLSCEVRLPDDSLSLPVYASLIGGGTRAESDTAWIGYVNAVLATLQRAYVLPSELGTSAFGTPVRVDRAVPIVTKKRPETMLGITPALWTVISFTLDSAGRVTGAQVTASALSGEADTSALAAVAEAAFHHALPPMPATLTDRRPIRFAFIVTTRQAPDGSRSMTVGRLAVPLWELKRAVAAIPDSQPNLGLDGLPGGASSDSAALEFVVDEHGRVVMSTVRVISPRADSASAAGHQVFVGRLLHALPRFAFTPALIGGCPVRATISQVFGWSRNP
jgi:TonB family protein